MSFKVTVDTGDLEAQATAAGRIAARAVLTELKGRYDAAFNPAVWNWPRETQRGGSFRRDGTRTAGVTVSSPRNIIDSEQLRDSLEVRFINAFVAEYRWTAQGAAAVHQGARLRSGTLLPARPWTAAVRGTQPRQGIPVYPLAERFARRWLASLQGN